jgi:hypothetical protein
VSRGATGTGTGSSRSKDAFIRGIQTGQGPTTLEARENWDTWQRSFRAIALSHQLHNVLDPSYVPSSADEVDLFKEQNVFLFSV